MIRQHFEAYGSVQSVDTVNKESIGANAIKTSDVQEAYVTFAQSEDAYNGFMANRRGSKAIKVLPADTWRQPGVNVIPFEEVKATNPDCGEKVSISDGFKNMCDCGQMVMTVHLRQPLCLKRVLEAFRPMKNRINHSKIIFDVQPNDIHVNCLTNDEYVKRAIQVICTCTGERLKELTIYDVKTMTIDLLDDLAPMLQRLEHLTLTINSNASVLYALPEYCPNLTDLSLNSMSWDGECSDSVVQSWPSICDLTLAGNLKIDNETETGENFQRFIELNPQLKSLQLDTIVDNAMFTTITKHLPNLTHLGFGRMTYDDIERPLDQLDQLKHLISLKISTLKVEKNGLIAMQTCAKRFRKMEKLKTAILFQNLEPDTLQKEEYVRLFSVAMKEHDGCVCHGSQRTLEIENHMIKLPKDRPVLIVCVNTKNFDSADIALMPKVIIGFEQTKQFYPNVIDKILVEGEDNFLSIYVSYA